MNATARYTLDEKHFRQAYSDWLRYVSRWKRWAAPLGLLLLIVGIVLRITIVPDGILPIALMAIGIYELLAAVIHKKQWIRDRLSTHSNDQNVEIHFSEETVRMTGPYSNSTCSWKLFVRCVPTPHGMFLYPEKGIHIYVPDSALSPPDAKQEIVERIRNKRAEPAPGPYGSPAAGSPSGQA